MDALEHTRRMLQRLEESQIDLQIQRADIARLETEKQDLEEARCQANTSLEQAMAEIETLRQEAEKASIRLKSELENAGDVVQEQAQVHAMVLREKSMLECDLSAAKERISSLDAQMQDLSNDYDLLKARIVDLEDVLAAENSKVDQGLEREAEQDNIIQTLQLAIKDGMMMLQDYSEDADKTLAGSVRGLIRLCESGVGDVSRLEAELARLQEALSDSSAEIHRLEGLRGSDSEVALEMQCEKDALENKIKFLNECLAKEHENMTKTIKTSEKLAADLRDARSHGDAVNERCNSAQVENNQLSRDLGIVSKTCASQQMELDALSATNRQLEHNLTNLQQQEARTSAQLIKRQAALSDSQLQEIEIAQKCLPADKAREALREQNSSLSVQLQRSSTRGKELLDHISVMHAALKDNEEFSLEQCFEVAGLHNELSFKCRALDEMHYAVANGERDREQLMRTSMQLEMLTKQRAADVRKLSLSETNLRHLLSCAALAQEEIQTMVLELSVAMGLVERQIGHTISALNTIIPRSKSPPAGVQGNLIVSLTQLEGLR